MKLTILGCTGSMSGPNSAGSSYLLQAKGQDAQGNKRLYSVVIDLGPGGMGQLLNYVNPRDLDAIIISHTHADHCADLVGMQVYRHWHPEGEIGTVPLYMPGDGRKRLLELSGDEPEQTYATDFDFFTVKQGSVIEVGPIKIEFFAAWHTIEALAMRIMAPSETNPNRNVVLTYTGDTDYCQSVLQASKDADLLLSEAAFLEGRDVVRGVHMTGLRAGELAANANVQRMIITHVPPWTDARQNMLDASKVFTKDISVAKPGDVYEI